MTFFPFVTCTNFHHIKNRKLKRSANVVVGVHTTVYSNPQEVTVVAIFIKGDRKIKSLNFRFNITLDSMKNVILISYTTIKVAGFF